MPMFCTCVRARDVVGTRVHANGRADANMSLAQGIGRTSAAFHLAYQTLGSPVLVVGEAPRGNVSAADGLLGAVWLSRVIPGDPSTQWGLGRGRFRECAMRDARRGGGGVTEP